MKKLKLCTLILIFAITHVKAQQAPITGFWYSKDGSRQYQITESKSGWEAVLVQSERENDKEGKLILSRLQKKRNRYRGTIFSATDNMNTTVTIRVSRKKNEVLVLKLKRMLLLDVTIKWYRDPK